MVDDGVEVERYTYDPNGNRLSATVRGELHSAAYDDRDRLTSYGPWTLQYDAHGRLATRVRSDRGESTGYEYDTRGNLLAVHLQDGRVVSYAANAAGQRVLRRVDGLITHGYVYAGDRVVAELATDGSVRSRFVYGHLGHVPAGMWRDGVWYAFVTDVRGSVRAVVHADTGQVVQALDYDTFGVVLADSSPGFQPFGFAGGLYDPDTGLVRYGARDYIAELGRWTAPDPLGFAAGDTSLYVYAFSDPVNLIDPSGEIAFCPLFMAAMWGYKIASAIMSLMDLLEKSQEFMDPCTSDERRMEMLAEALADMLASLALGKLGQKLGKDLLGMLAKKYGLKACFIAGTLVATAGGAQAIETLAPGDAVLAVDEHTNVVSKRALLGVSSREVERYLDVRLESPGQAAGAEVEAEHLGVTAEHPFWTSVGWKAAAELVPGDVVLSPHSGWLRVGGSTWVQGPVRVWNLEVEEDHTFAVGGLGAWVHNGCGPIRAAAVEGEELSKGRTLTEKEAIERLRRGEDVWTAAKQDAKSLQRRSGHGKPISDPAHGEGYYPHYHDSARSGGHAFYGDPEH